ncbi:MAG: hypothetical protein GXO65_01470, partial [Euryarchaeota archaeon]|nr:hypothetical protein [Euryarchaeota archaeon]
RVFSPMEISKKFYPNFYDGDKVKKFIVPIQPEYHDRLFVGYGGRQTKLFEHDGEFITEGNTIKKAYLCHAPAKTISPGDILLFYRSWDMRKLTVFGVVEEVFPELTDKGEIVRKVGRRTVYSLSEIEQMAKNPTLLILFTLHFPLKNPLGLAGLIKMGVLKSAPQSITQISHEKYQLIKKEGGIDERFAVN